MELRRFALPMYIVIISTLFGSYSVLRFLDLRFYGDAPTSILTICQYPSHKGVLKVHFSYALLLFKPLCAVMPCWLFVATLAFLQGVGLGLATYAIYSLAREVLGSWKLAFVASLAYAFHPAMHGIVSFDIHPEAYALPLVALGAKYLVTNKSILKGYFLMISAVLFKETAAFPLLGVMIWRTATKKVKHKTERLFVVLILVVAPLLLLLILKLRLVNFQFDRWNIFFEKPSARFNYVKVQFLIVTLLSVFPSLIPNVNVLLWLPDFLNFLFTTSWYKFKFWYGFQYPVFLITMMVIAAILNTSKLKGRLRAGVWGAQLALVLILAVVADPLAYWAMIYEYYYYYSSGGEPAPYPIYPWTSLTTYRPIAPNYLHCFWKALELYDVASKYLKPGERVSVPDTLMSIFSCKYEPLHTGNMAMKDWYWNSRLTPQRIAVILATWLRAHVFVNMYGTVRTMDIPKYIWDEVVEKAIMVKDAGYVFIMNQTKLARLKSILSGMKVIWLANGTFAIVGKDGGRGSSGSNLFKVKYGLATKDGKLVPSLYDYVPKYGIKNITWLEGYIYVGVDGTYELYGSPAVLEIEIDNVTLKPTKRIEVMQDFVHASYFGKLRLTEGWHKIKVKIFPGWVQLYWKTPFSCAPYPPSAARFLPSKELNMQERKIGG